VEEKKDVGDPSRYRTSAALGLQMSGNGVNQAVQRICVNFGPSLDDDLVRTCTRPGVGVALCFSDLLFRHLIRERLESSLIIFVPSALR